MAERIIPPKEYQLGAIYDAISKSVEFRLWSPFASRVVVRLYKASIALNADYSLELAKDEATGVWKATFDSEEPDAFLRILSVLWNKGEYRP